MLRCTVLRCPLPGEVHALDSPGVLLEGSMGLLGVVTEVTLFVQRATKVAVKVMLEEDNMMVRGVGWGGGEGLGGGPGRGGEKERGAGG